MSHRFRLLLLLGLLASSAIVYLIGNGSVSLWDRDEPRFAQTSRQMLTSGDWVVPHYLDQIRTAKPALIYWCQAGAMKLFGANEFAARFPSAVAATMLLIVFAAVLWRTVGSEMALWTVFILATSGLTIVAAKMCITDAVLTLWVTIAQLCFYAIWQGNRSWRIVLTLWIAIGLAGLTKGPVVLGFLATTALTLTLFEGRWNVLFIWRRDELRNSAALSGPSSHWRTFTGVCKAIFVAVQLLIGWRIRAIKTLRWLRFTRPLLGLLVAAVIILPWVVMVYFRATGFIGTGIKHEIWDRILTPLEQHKGPPGYYFLTVWLTFFPWSLLLPLAIGLGFVRRSDPKARFALSAVIGPWIMLECVKTKLPHYFLPAFPALAYLTADALIRCVRGEIADLQKKSFIIPVGIWAMLVAVAASAPWLVQYHPLPHLAMAAMSGFGALFGLSVFLSFYNRRIATGAIAMGLGTFGFIAIVFGLYLPHADFLRLSPRVAKILIDNHVTGDGQVIMLDYMEPSLAFAQGGTIREAGLIGFLPKFEPQMPRWLVVTKTIWDAAPQSLRDDFDVVGTEFGLAYANRGKWMTVMVIRKK